MNDYPHIIHILAVEDDDVDHIALARSFRKCSFETSIVRAETLATATDLLKKSEFHCIMLDYRLPDGTGLDLLSSTEYSRKSNHTAVIMLTGEDDISIAVEAMKNGAKDYIPKKLICAGTLEISINKALETIALERKVHEYQQRIEELAFYDSLTELPNRNVFEDRLLQLIKMSKRSDETFMVGILDLDNFKAINDNLGHQAGDRVLRIVASRLARAIRQGDTVARYGGDEFVLLLPEEEIKFSAAEFSHRILETISQPFSIAGKEITVGASLGLSKYPFHGDDGVTLLKKADEALYLVKNNRTGAHWKIIS